MMLDGKRVLHWKAGHTVEIMAVQYNKVCQVTVKCKYK